jgi:hypothetical protein
LASAGLAAGRLLKDKDSHPEMWQDSIADRYHGLL